MKKVYLVGAGPGDPELITLKGLNLIRKADIIICDRLVSEELLMHARNATELIYVGKIPKGSWREMPSSSRKRTGKHTFTQEEINKILVEKAREGKIVVRLKGGDPFVFGRGGEEIRALKKHGIAFEVVPGVTSAIAAPALANIPVTDRMYASSFTVATGQEDPTKIEQKLDYGSLKADTIVILMGIGNLKKIVAQMLKTRSRNTPVAIIEEGATKRQRVVVGTLGNIVKKAEKAKVKPPAVIVVGDVVKLRKEFGR
ncbi:MAG: uroporphyrinogen-III C-methyltransferase [Candidatus Hydrothermarchaeota archaeon]|nr:uroporphyrinogen-III C-methyltransferase [Candidatus Hydrothermarchaeota archaeon]